MPIHAYAAAGPGKPLEPFSFEPEPLGPHDIEIGITHCGICHSDIHMIDNDWGWSTYPLVPGHEVVGIVREAGAEVRRLSAGQRVGVGWQSGSCLECEWCLSGRENCCARQQGTIVGRHGGFADALRVDERFAFPIPEAIESSLAGPLLCGGVTVYSPLREDARPWFRVGVVGIGGLGHLAIQFARAFGCEVTAFSTSAGKRAEALELGAHEFVVSTDAGRMKAAAGSLDLLLSATTARLDWQAWVGLLRPRGILTIVGASPGALDVEAGAILTGQKTVRGSLIGGRARLAEMLDFAARSGVRPRAEIVPMREVNAAIAKVRRNRARYRMVLEA